MICVSRRILSLVAATVLVFGLGRTAVADDTEIFLGMATAGVKPNILFVLDTSGSMDSDVVVENAPYDPATTYAGSCNTSRIYWVRDQGDPFYPPDCGTDNWFNLSANKCLAMTNAFASDGLYAADKAAQWRPGNTRWENIRNTVRDQAVECIADAGIHGDGVNTLRLYARDNAAMWGTAAQSITWNANNTNRAYVFYSANYLNWWNNPTNVQIKSRLQVMQDVSSTMLGNLKGVNVGLMRYSNNTNDGCDDSASAEGGMVAFPVSDIDTGTNRTDLINTVKSYSAAGCTPLSETLYEATRYYMGTNWVYGKDARINPGTAFPSVPASRMASPNTNQYKTPIGVSCQKNYIVYLTDGEPTADTSASASILALPNFNTLVGSRCTGTGDGACLPDLAEYLFDADLNSTQPGKQNVVSYWIGFGPDVNGSTLLQQTAARGGGKFYSADNTTGLSAVLSSIVTEILRSNTTFTAPSVSVNAFNRTQTLNDLYVSVFRPDQTYRWPGNVKKYRVDDGQIVDANGNPAVNAATGFFADTAQSFWSTGVDGANVSRGGAASQQPSDPARRNVFINLDPGSNDLAGSPNNQLNTANLLITNALLGVGAPGQPAKDDIVEWARGRDVQDADLDNDETEARLDMGDPLHAKPAVVIYGGTNASPNIDDAVVYVPTNDGFLHAIDARTGQELWAFVPADLADTLLPLYLNTTVTNKSYALDAEVKVLKYDVDQDGIVEPGSGDRVLLYVGQRRGGSNYYAVEVTDKTQPRFLWERGTSQLTGLGQTWSAPVITRVTVSGATQNSQKLVLVFGGGYDDTQDLTGYRTSTVGSSIYMIDALTGNLLWRGCNGCTNYSSTRMVHSFPGNISVLDLDGDTFADRMYATDMGGLLWRFDIYSGSTVTNLVTGGVFADLGAASLASPKPVSATRRMYNTPDVALIRRRGDTAYFNIAFGSGFRGHPLDTAIQDRFYSIRDYRPFTKLTQVQANAWVPLTDAGLVDVTTTTSPTMPTNATGWRMELRLPGGWVGEKVLAESRTFDNKIFFPTYTPSSGAVVNSCSPQAGSNRAYIVNVADASPAVEQDGVAGLTVADRYTNLSQGGIAPEVVMLFPAPDPANPTPANQSPLVCLSGAEVLSVCTNFTSRFKTTWSETGAQ